MNDLIKDLLPNTIVIVVVVVYFLARFSGALD